VTRGLRQTVLGLALLASAAGCSHERTLTTSDGRTRRYLVRAPEGWDQVTPLPVVLVFHGGGGDDKGAESSTGMTAAAHEAGYLVVYPQGVGKKLLGKRFGTWNAGACCGTALEEQVDDVAFVSELIDALAQDFVIDARRVYATGLSNGAFMVGRLACELSDRIAAVAPIAGVYFTEDCQPSQPVPIMIIHGTEDQCVDIAGGAQCGGCFTRAIEQTLETKSEVQDSFPCDSVTDAAAFWIARDGCEASPETTHPNPDTTCTRYPSCADGAEVRSCVVEGGGHTWPGSEYDCNPRRDLCQTYMETVGHISTWDANRAMLEFFGQHTLP